MMGMGTIATGVLTVALVGAAFAGTDRAGSQPAGPDKNSLGPQVGQAAPDFEARDQHGAVRSLESLLGPSGAMIVFYRSADW
jgi:hypothetical protein